MSKKKQILDVDFIGGQGELTTTEEKALSEYFQKIKLKSKVKPKVKTRIQVKKQDSIV